MGKMGMDLNGLVPSGSRTGIEPQPSGLLVTKGRYLKCSIFTFDHWHGRSFSAFLQDCSRSSGHFCGFEVVAEDNIKLLN
jgi:hypothetical protein